MVQRIDKLIMAGEISVVSTRIRKEFLIFSGYQYRIHRKNWKLNWTYVKVKCGKCKGKLKNTLQ
jgi:hypothetical protein